MLLMLRYFISLTALLSICVIFLQEANATEKTKQTVAGKHVHHKKQDKKQPTLVALPNTNTSFVAENLNKISQLSENNFVAAKKISDTFNNDALEPYAKYLLLKSHINQPEYNADIAAFISQFSETNWADNINKNWLDALEKRQDWRTILSNQYLFKSDTGRCAVLSALKNTKTIDEADWAEEAISYWQTDTNPSVSCQHVYDSLERANKITAAQWQQKLALLYFEGKISAIESMLAYLPEKEQAENKRILSLLKGNVGDHVRALIASANNSDEANSVEAQSVFVKVIKQLIKQNPDEALTLWNEGKAVYHFHELVSNKVEKQLYIRLAKQYPDQKVNWLTKIDPSLQDEVTLYPLMQEAWKGSDWTNLLRYISWLPEQDQQADIWQYWQAKALSQTGQTEQAQPIYEALAKKRSFYGFMAADKIGADYQLNTQTVTAEQIANTQQTPLAKRLWALYEAGLKDVAWKEWNYAKNNNKVKLSDIPGYAQTAQTLGWYAFSALSLGNPAHWDYTQLRFASPYQSIVTPNALDNDISLAWAYGIIRRESAYSQDARSTSGAMGLMQLMPKTARALAPIPNISDVYKPELNVQLGTKLLGQLKKEFNGNLVFATASYNAGGFRVRQWLKQLPNVPSDQWIELIPYKETRDYVKAVMEYMLVFERQGITANTTRLSQYFIDAPEQLSVAENKCNPMLMWCL
ncbi:MAG: lytic transglycosylase domain-containing protein [Proteobacteria bacterium]|nr:lytic transglycosylase domain-containing protein [Pseudomonadota bacterium]